MLTRSTRSMVTFANVFMMGNSQQELPAGTYEIVVEEELLQGLSFEAYRRIATHLIVRGCGRQAGQMAMRTTTKEELDYAIACDRTLSETNKTSDAALPPQENTT